LVFGFDGDIGVVVLPFQVSLQIF